jgi:hypothetical protein
MLSRERVDTLTLSLFPLQQSASRNLFFGTSPNRLKNMPESGLCVLRQDRLTADCVAKK